MLNLEILERHVEELSNSSLLHYVPENSEMYAGIMLLTMLIGPLLTIATTVFIYSSKNWKQRLQTLPIFAIGCSLLLYGYFVFSPVSLTVNELAMFNQLRVDSGKELISKSDYVSRAALRNQLNLSFEKQDELLLLKERLAAIGIHPDENQLVMIASLERR